MTPTVAVFDILGTVLDERGGFRGAAATALPDDVDGAAFADPWSDAVSAGIAEIAKGAAPWRPWDEVIEQALADTAARSDAVPAAGLRSVGHRLPPWPDSREGLAAIRSGRAVVALSNAGVTALMDCFRAGGLQWDAVLSSEMVRSAKPDPRVYRFLLDTLRIEPGQVVMVAAHPWDLRAAAERGMRTAYVRRGDEGTPGPDDRFDWTADDLIDLARQLEREPAAAR